MWQWLKDQLIDDDPEQAAAIRRQADELSETLAALEADAGSVGGRRAGG